MRKLSRKLPWPHTAKQSITREVRNGGMNIDLLASLCIEALPEACTFSEQLFLVKACRIPLLPCPNDTYILHSAVLVLRHHDSNASQRRGRQERPTNAKTCGHQRSFRSSLQGACRKLYFLKPQIRRLVAHLRNQAPCVSNPSMSSGTVLRRLISNLNGESIAEQMSLRL